MEQRAVYGDCSVATMMAGDTPYGLIADAKVVIAAGQIEWVGDAAHLPVQYSDDDMQSLGGRLVTPALIDCHTHLIFGSNRAHEFEMRLQGASYEEIARKGGGIISTVHATRSASDADLIASALARIDDLIADGVSVIEIKSGYGLNREQEMRMLRIARHLEILRPVKIVTTWLAAHAIPPEYQNKSDQYIDEVVIPGLESAHKEGLVDAVDGFCETIAFSPVQIERVFKTAKALGLPVKLHAEQLSDQKGALLTARYDGLSADHLEYLADEDVAAFAASNAVAVILPGAFYTLKETKRPPIESLRNHSVDMAIATDCNPGSSPISSLLTIMNMACTLFAMTPEEALTGVTRNAAKALGLNGEYGIIAPGMTADLAVWNVTHPAELSYWVGASPLFKKVTHERNP